MATDTSTPTMWRSLAESDPEIAKAIKEELHRQNSGLELIASENFVSRAIARMRTVQSTMCASPSAPIMRVSC